MNKVKACIWGRDFELFVSYQNFPGEEVTDTQEQVLKSIPLIDYSISLRYVEQYILKYYGMEIKESRINNIFRYVIPKSVLITRDENMRIFAIMCNFKYDMEHGLAIVYENEQYKAVGPQDIIL